MRRLIERCLRKNPQDRLRDIGDARIELNEEEGEKPPEGSAERAPRYQVALPWAVAVVTLTIFALYLSQNAGPSAPAPIVRFALSDPVELAVSGGMMTTFALSPDGSRLVYRASTAGLSQLYLRRLEDVEPTALPGTEMSRGHVFSPDGQAVAFLTAQGELNTYSITGRLAVRRTRTRFPNSLTAGLSWNEDDEIVLGGRGRGLQIVSADGATVDEVTTLDPDLQETGHLLPAFLPGGRVVIFTRLSSDGSTAIEAFERDTGERRILMEGASGAVYASTGHLLFARDGALLSAPFDVEALHITGPSIRVVEPFQEANGTGNFVLSDTGVLVYATGNSRQLVWVDRQGREEPPFDEAFRAYGWPRISPGGNDIAFLAGGRIGLLNLRRGTSTELLGEVFASAALFTPDGRHLVFGKLDGVYLAPTDRSGPDENIAPSSGGLKLAGSVSPDGRELAFLGWTEHGSDVFILPLDGSGEVRAFLDSAAHEGGPQFSPDGHLLSYVSDASGQREVYVTDYPGPGPNWQVSNDGGTQPVWNPKGGELFYRNGDRMMSVRVGDSPEATSQPVILFEGRYAFGQGITIPNYDVASDGNRFLMVKDFSASLGNVRVVLNWFAELERLVPTEK